MGLKGVDIVRVQQRFFFSRGETRIASVAPADSAGGLKRHIAGSNINCRIYWSINMMMMMMMHPSHIVSTSVIIRPRPHRNIVRPSVNNRRKNEKGAILLRSISTHVIVGACAMPTVAANSTVSDRRRTYRLRRFTTNYIDVSRLLMVANGALSISLRWVDHRFCTCTHTARRYPIVI